MKKGTWIFLGVTLVVLGVLAACQQRRSKGELTAGQVEAISTDAYTYGYPLISREITRRAMTEGGALDGQFIHTRVCPMAAFDEVASPNADTLYSTAWIDLSSGPYILHVPDAGRRYRSFSILNGWGDVVLAVGPKAADYLLVGPQWQGEVPGGMQECRLSTHRAQIVGRIYCSGTREDCWKVHALQEQYTLQPLNSISPREMGTAEAPLHGPPCVRGQIEALGSCAYFQLLADLLVKNPPAATDAPLLEKMARLGVVPGKPITCAQCCPSGRKVLEQTPQRARKKMHLQMGERATQGWRSPLPASEKDYLQKACLAQREMGDHLPDALQCAYTTTDTWGRPLQGERRYILHFNPEQLPSAQGLWSLTLYTPDFCFVPNRLNRYSLNSKQGLYYNPDGSLDLYIQHDTPAPTQERNWLPAPTGPFVLILRVYGPKEGRLFESGSPPLLECVLEERE